MISEIKYRIISMCSFSNGKDCIPGVWALEYLTHLKNHKIITNKEWHELWDWYYKCWHARSFD
jgi:hypothetical protein